MGKLKIIAGNANPDFAAKVAKHSGLELCKSKINRFSDGEIQVEIHESIRGADVFVIQSACPPVNENYMELFILLDALKRASAKSITAVIPYFGYARQDRKVKPRVPISAKCVSDLISAAGANRVVSVDLHSAQIQGFFNIPFDHLFSFPTLAKAWREEMGAGDDFVVVSPDAGGVERARIFAKKLECPIAIIDKRRTGPNEAKAYNLIGSVEGKIAIVADDMVDTAGTLTEGIKSLVDNGAKKVFAVATHPLLTGPAIDRINDSPIEQLWVTDTIPLNENAQKCKKIKVISVASVVSDAIQRIYGNDSVSILFDE
ncbi:MAG: ribose-phosphate pyrophosphokinase [Bdellovibrionaceae bacterium]|nr:ribose-phosphate pyrophosphokinase [Pseudobdellovibrionaceae bacterium]